MSALSLTDITMTYGSLVAVERASFEVATGQTFGLIGLNGAGKTTLIKAILGLRNIQGGVITVGEAAPGSPAAKAQISYLPERFDPPWFLTGMEFLLFTAKLYGHTTSKKYFEEQVARVDLDPAVLSRRVQTYSKGMRQKLGLIATLAAQCSTLILDEPTSGLDPIARVLVRNLLCDARKDGRTVFLSSHILVDMDVICDNVAILHDKVITFTGTPASLHAQTKTHNLEDAFLSLIGYTKNSS